MGGMMPDMDGLGEEEEDSDDDGELISQSLLCAVAILEAIYVELEFFENLQIRDRCFNFTSSGSEIFIETYFKTQLIFFNFSCTQELVLPY